MPPYLHDLIARVFTSYTPAGSNPGSHLRFVMNLLSTGAEVAFIDLNYDPYLETALIAFDRQRLVINSMDDYTAQGGQAIVCKVHGSIDWGLRMAQGAWQEVVKSFKPERPHTIVLNKHRRECFSWLDADERFGT